MSAGAWQSRARWARTVLGLVLGGVLVWALLRGWSTAQPLLLRSPLGLALPVLLIMAALVLGSRMWVLLARKRSGRDASLAYAFLAALPAKYLPGGAGLLAAAQVGLSLEARSEVTSTGISYVVFSILQLISGAIVGSLVAVVDVQAQVAYRVLAAAGVLFVLALRREWMSDLVSLVLRLVRRTSSLDPIPPQSSLNRSVLLALAAMMASGIAFTLILDGSLRSVFLVAPAFAAAWAVGFVAVPIPAGLGIREAALVVLLPEYGAAPVLAASILYRLAALFAELILMATVWRRAFASKSSGSKGRES